jgi:hypothetical protein
MVIPELMINQINISGTNQTSSVKLSSNNPRNRLYKSYYGLFNADFVNGSQIPSSSSQNLATLARINHSSNLYETKWRSVDHYVNSQLIA